MEYEWKFGQLEGWIAPLFTFSSAAGLISSHLYNWVRFSDFFQKYKNNILCIWTSALILGLELSYFEIIAWCNSASKTRKTKITNLGKLKKGGTCQLAPRISKTMWRHPCFVVLHVVHLRTAEKESHLPCWSKFRDYGAKICNNYQRKTPTFSLLLEVFFTVLYFEVIDYS